LESELKKAFSDSLAPTPTHTKVKIKSLTKHRGDCRICKRKDLVKFLSFGKMPLAGGFIKKDEIKNEKSYPLDVYFCRNCKEEQ